MALAERLSSQIASLQTFLEPTPPDRRATITSVMVLGGTRSLKPGILVGDALGLTDTPYGRSD